MRASWRVLITAAVALAATSVGAAGVARAGIEPPSTDVTIFVATAGSQQPNAASYTPSFTPAGPGGQVGDCTSGVTNTTPFATTITYICTLTTDDVYTVSVPTPPTPFVADHQCGASGISDTDQIDLTGSWESPGCFITVAAPTVFVEKDFLGSTSGPLEVDDFTLQVFPAAGGAAIGTATDPDEEFCASPNDAETLCGYIELEPGEYAFGEVTEYGYFPAIAECSAEPYGEDEDITLPPGELTPLPEIIRDEGGEPVATFTVGAENMFAYCAVANVYLEGTINVFKTVTNSHGGTAGPADWTVELYDDTNTLVDEAVCNPDGSCIAGDYPIGQYTIGERGPDGYTSTLTISIVEAGPTEALDDPEATFDLTPLAVVDATIASQDQPTTTTTAATTTTLVTTTMATTTVAPTLATTTTAFDAGGITLPPTGSDSGTSSLALVAALFLLFGGLAVLATRRR